MRFGPTGTFLAIFFRCREELMTDPTGRSFLSYRRTRSTEAALIAHALHEHGIPTWQDIRNLGSVPTEGELRRVLADPEIANAVLFITPDVENSPIIRNVEVPLIVKRVEKSDGFFAVPLAAAGLDYAMAAEVTRSNISARSLAEWNMERCGSESITEPDADRIAERVLSQRLEAVHRALPADAPLRIGFFVRRSPAFQPGDALTIDWSGRFEGKEAPLAVWTEALLPCLSRVVSAIRANAPGRPVEAFGLPTLPAALALGCAFISTGGIKASWRQLAPGMPEQIWDLGAERVATGFSPKIWGKDPDGRDLAVLVSVADDVEPLFASTQESLPSLRAVIHVRTDAQLPFRIESAGQAHDIARVIEDGIRTARREYGAFGTVHIFIAAPAGVAVLTGQLLNTLGAVQAYEHVPGDGSGAYHPGPLLHPSN